MKKYIMKSLFQGMAFMALGLSFASCNDAHEFPREDFPRDGEIRRSLTIGQTMTFEIGDYTSNDTYIGEVSPADGTPQVFTPFHTGSCIVSSPNHDMAVYRIVVSGTVAPFDGIDLAWGTTFDEMLEKKGINENTDGVDKANGTITETGADKPQYVYHFTNGVLDNVTANFLLDDIAAAPLDGEQVLLTYLTENFNFTQGAEGYYGTYFNQVTLEKATTVINIKDYVPEANDNEETATNYDLTANFYNAKTVQL